MSRETSSIHVGEGEPLMLIHPFGTDARVWHGVAGRLSDEFEVFAPTLPGHNRGPKLGKNPSVYTLTDNVESRMDELGWDTAHVAGNSLGGWISVELAKRGRARTATPIGPAGGWEPNTFEELKVGLAFIAAYPAVKAASYTANLLMRNPRLRHLILAPAAARGELAERREAEHLLRAVGSCAMYSQLIGVGLRSRGATDLHTIDVPVRVLSCEKDLIVPHKAYGERYVREIPGAEHEVLPGVGHVPMLEAPQLVADAIRRHITDRRAKAMSKAA